MPLAVGLMSGTSCDGVSAAVVELSPRRLRVLSLVTRPYPPSLRRRLLAATALTVPELSRLQVTLGERFAAAALQALRAARRRARDVAVIGSHGHTVYHGPRQAVPSTLQIGSAAVIAERTGCAVVADFRPADVAAGGEGAPLVPAFDAAFFGRGAPRALLNLGGIANLTLVGRSVRTVAFDTGPGNCLIDRLAACATHGRRRYDPDGRLAAQGRVNDRALARALRHPFFSRRPPKSTGPDEFSEAWWRQVAGTHADAHALATATALTARSVAESVRRFLPKAPEELVVSGGGAHNRTLMAMLADAVHPVPVISSARYGLPPLAKEPAAFAYFAWQRLNGHLNHLPETTGASGARLLGALTAAPPS